VISAVDPDDDLFPTEEQQSIVAKKMLLAAVSVLSEFDLYELADGRVVRTAILKALSGMAAISSEEQAAREAAIKAANPGDDRHFYGFNTDKMQVLATALAFVMDNGFGADIDEIPPQSQKGWLLMEFAAVVVAIELSTQLQGVMQDGSESLSLYYSGMVDELLQNKIEKAL
jgi:hypothetical protein